MRKKEKEKLINMIADMPDRKQIGLQRQASILLKQCMRNFNMSREEIEQYIDKRPVAKENILRDLKEIE